MGFSKPKIEHLGELSRFTWDDPPIIVTAIHAQQHREGRISAEFVIERVEEDKTLLILRRQLSTVLGPRAQSTLADELTRRYLGAPWSEILEYVCAKVVEILRVGEPVFEISTADVIHPPEYLVKPILIKGQPNILFGLGGACKSYMALSLGICALLPWVQNPLKLEVNEKSSRILYLDYESDRDTVTWRMKRLQLGLNIPYLSMQYRSCCLPLADETDAIQNIVMDHKIELLIVDSAGGASGGDLNKTEGVLRFFAALRRLKVTSLIVAHTSKPQNGDTRSATPYGNAYYTNYARSIWEVRREQQADSDVVNIGLFDSKSNDRGKMSALAFRLTFTGSESATIERQQIADVPEFEKTLPLRDRIVNLLWINSPLTFNQVFEELHVDDAKITENNVRVTLSRLCKGTQTKPPKIETNNGYYSAITGV